MGERWTWRVERHELVESTNTLAAERVRAAFAEAVNIDRLAIVAEKQTGGRGQHGRVWESPAGGLYVSAVVQEMAAGAREKLSLLAGGVVAKALRECEGEMPLHLRWPNDVMLGGAEGQKVAGILCESIGQGSQFAVIVGIGINVNTEVARLPMELRGRATSLRHFLGREANPEKILAVLLMGLDGLLWHEGLVRQIFEEVRAMDCLYEQAVEFQHDQEVVKGVGAGIDERGHLLIRMGRDGPVRAFASGTLRSVNGRALR